MGGIAVLETYQMTATLIMGLFSLSALVLFGYAIWFFMNRQRALAELAEIKQKLDETSVSDPAYNTVRAVYVAMMLDAHQSGMLSPSGQEFDDQMSSATSGSGQGDGGDGSAD
jgi:hypothetical protein